MSLDTRLHTFFFFHLHLTHLHYGGKAASLHAKKHLHSLKKNGISFVELDAIWELRYYQPERPKTAALTPTQIHYPIPAFVT